MTAALSYIYVNHNSEMRKHMINQRHYYCRFEFLRRMYYKNNFINNGFFHELTHFRLKQVILLLLNKYTHFLLANAPQVVL